MQNSSLLETMRRVVELLRSEKCTYALAGGILVSGYREDVRATNDIDLLLQSDQESTLKAKNIIISLGLIPRLVKLHNLKRSPMMNKKSAPVLIVVGRGSELDIGVDFILPDMPWFGSAITRAQSNLIDFGFGEIPCITIEDMIIAKIFAGRDKDLDDLKSIFRKGNQIDIEYLSGEIIELKLAVPRDVQKLMPKQLQKIVKKKR